MIKGYAPIRPPQQKMEPANLARHQALCTICQSEHKADIESDYIHWHSYRELVERYFPDKAPDLYLDNFKVSMLRHVRLFGLDIKKAKNVISALTKVAEQGMSSLNGQKITPNITIDALKEIDKVAKTQDFSGRGSVEPDTTMPDNREDMLRLLQEELGKDDGAGKE